MKKNLILFLLMYISQNIFTQTTGDYRSKVATGNWDAAASWERFDGTNWVAASTPPSSADGVISILTGHSITIAAAATADQIVVDAGGELKMESNLTLNNGTGDDLVINGTMNWHSGNMDGMGNLVVAPSGVFAMFNNFLLCSVPITNNGLMERVPNIAKDLINNATINTGSYLLINGQNTGTLHNHGDIQAVGFGGVVTMGLTINNYGTFTFQGGGFIVSQGNFNNAGIFNLNTYFRCDGIFVNNPGSEYNGNSTLDLNDLILNTNLVVPSGITLKIKGSTTGGGNMTINGPLVIAGNVQGSGSLTVNGNITWVSGTINSNLIVPAGSTLEVSSSDDKILNGNLVMNGTLNWQDGNIILAANNSSFVNNGSINIQGNQTLSSTGSNTVFVNNGTISNCGTGTTTIFNASTIINSSTGVLKGNGTYEFQGNYTPGGTIAPGCSPGILAINGPNQPLSANSILEIEILNTSGPGIGHDQLTRDGNLTLAGTLTVTETGASVPAGTYVIINLTSGTISGDFATINLPPGYTLQKSSNTVSLVKSVVAPLKLISFNAISNGPNKVLLTWITESEVNTSHFDIEKSDNGYLFQKIGVVNTKNTYGRHAYSYTDVEAIPGNSYYRLKQVDLDGSFEYSKIQTVYINYDNSKMILMPNPTIHHIHIQGISVGTTIQVYDDIGRQVLSKVWNNSPLDVGNLPTGIYHLHAYHNGEVLIERFVKL